MSKHFKRSQELGLLIVVGGPGGSGASTIARKLAKHFSLKYLYGGELMRNLAREKGFKDLNDFLHSKVFQKNHGDFDYLVDEKLFEKSFSKDILIDSKVFAGLATKHEIPCTVKIWLDADISVRVNRTLGKKDFGDFEKIRFDLESRYERDKKRFFELYGIEFDCPENYNDIVIDSSEQKPEETFALILKLIDEGKHLELD
jgi:CMP/dCMP kinase